MEPFLDTNLFKFFLLPLLIILARIVDVSIGTVKIIFIAKGYKKIAPILGFFEVMIWLTAVTQVIGNLDNIVCFLAYCFGFALGSYIGIFIEERIALGVELIRIITRRGADNLIQALRDEGYGITVTKAEGNTGKVGIIYTVINRKNKKHVIELIKEHNPKAFYTIEDIRFVSHTPYQGEMSASKKIVDSVKK